MLFWIDFSDIQLPSSSLNTPKLLLRSFQPAAYIWDSWGSSSSAFWRMDNNILGDQAYHGWRGRSLETLRRTCTSLSPSTPASGWEPIRPHPAQPWPWCCCDLSNCCSLSWGRLACSILSDPGPWQLSSSSAPFPSSSLSFKVTTANHEAWSSLKRSFLEIYLMLPSIIINRGSSWFTTLYVIMHRIGSIYKSEVL